MYLHNGYQIVTKQKKKIKVHRIVMANALGRQLTMDECVIHKDNNRLNNDPSNLEIISREEHGRRVRELRNTPPTISCGTHHD